MCVCVCVCGVYLRVPVEARGQPSGHSSEITCQIFCLELAKQASLAGHQAPGVLLSLLFLLCFPLLFASLLIHPHLLGLQVCAIMAQF